MRLTAEEYVALEGALLDAFPDYDELGAALRRADLRIQQIAAPGSMLAVVGKVITHAETRDRVPELLTAARALNPTNVALLELSAAVGTGPGVPAAGLAPADRLPETHARLERMVDGDRGIADLGRFAERLHGLMRRVCAVELGNDAGTGFLIGPRTVLTNRHVVAKAADGAFPPDRIVLRFDYQRVRDGRVVNAGVEATLAEDWLVHSAAHGGFDTTAYVEGAAPQPDQLDYAVLRLAGPLGAERGWVEPRAEAFDFPAGAFLMIVQHPCHDPISFDFVQDAVVRVVGERLRVQYRTNTMPGSSGSPVLDRDLELVALHHAGQPGSPDVWLPCGQQVSPAEYNQGIPIATIQAHLDSHGLGWVFGGEEP